ncbi:hypothetical protein CH251_05390 [Rhodococcus sp. 06-462-5]|uniref:hypothetical protein n=1 Tax=unclassified Rhodococcus (in: high G+C Gram-positive bacteria) TaxID=192944 RepID=UPI000B9B7A2F|nr:MULTISPECIES: hypothetical protein [unclassified Rhodococcus (in: high G+C Gram-positive bacteria)]OZC77227.1 hypothetical protein CH251_05390 [Rhodococcus sp. 06-462-5]OZE63384.1 hypothetical protein CH270_17970 [Rhodococcus sp. 02-925g]
MLTSQRAHLVLDSARRNSAIQNVDLAAAVVDEQGDLVCCSKTDGAAPELLGAVLTAAAHRKCAQRFDHPVTFDDIEEAVVIESLMPNPIPVEHDRLDFGHGTWIVAADDQHNV